MISKERTKNILFITDLHVQSIDSFNDMFFKNNIKELFSRFDYWLNIQDENNKFIDLYIWGDIFNFIWKNNLNNAIFSLCWHIFLLQKYLDSKNLILNRVYYVIWNHECYLDIKDNYKIYFNDRFFITWIDIRKNYNYDLEEEFRKTILEKKFRSKKEWNIVTYTIPEKLENELSQENLFNFNYFDKENIINKIIKRCFEYMWIIFIWEVMNFEYLDDFRYDWTLKKWRIWTILFAPYLWKYQQNIEISKLYWLMNVNDHKFLKDIITSKNIEQSFWNIKKKFEYLFALKDEDVNQLYETHQNIKNNLSSYVKHLESVWIYWNQDLFSKVSYHITQQLFYYHYLKLLNDLSFLSKKENIEELDIVTHFAFDVFWDKIKEEYKIDHYCIDKSIYKQIERYKTWYTNSYFNVNEDFLIFIIKFIEKYFSKSLKKVNFYWWHTHLNHKSKFTHWNIDYHFLNSSFEYF